MTNVFADWWYQTERHCNGNWCNQYRPFTAEDFHLFDFSGKIDDEQLNSEQHYRQHGVQHHRSIVDSGHSSSADDSDHHRADDDDLTDSISQQLIYAIDDAIKQIDQLYNATDRQHTGKSIVQRINAIIFTESTSYNSNSRHPWSLHYYSPNSRHLRDRSYPAMVSIRALQRLKKSVQYLDRLSTYSHFRHHMNTPQMLTELNKLAYRNDIWQSICTHHHASDECSTMYQYRSANGRCNNVNNPQWGEATTTFQRILAADYNDG